MPRSKPSSSLFTVLLAFAANVLVAIAKTVAAGAVVSIMHGISALGSKEEDADYLVAYIVLAAAFVFEGVSFIQSYRQAHAKANSSGTGTFEHVLRTSNPTLRAVFAEDSAALVGLVIAFLGVLLHELTGNPFWDALGSILVGVLLAIVAVVLIERNRSFLLGQPGSDRAWEAALSALLQHPEVEKVTYLHLEYVGPERFFLVAAVDLLGDDRESEVAADLQSVEADLERSEWVTEAVITLSRPGASALHPAGAASDDAATLR